MEFFSFPNWYPSFEKDAGEAVVIPIPNDVLQYLRSGPLILPIEATPPPTRYGSSTEQNYSVDWNEDDDCVELEPPTFPKFSQKLKHAINCVGGIAFIKSNWHAAKDASWITTGRTLKCSSIEDVYLLLKGSDVICKDMTYEFRSDGSQDVHCVVVKRWIDFHPGCEFRCFVKDRSIIAISQRDCSSFYPHINARRYDIINTITNFFRSKIKEVFPCFNYVVDVVWLDNDSLQIIDFQPFDQASTKNSLFKWEELTTINSNDEDDDVNDDDDEEEEDEEEEEEDEEEEEEIEDEEAGEEEEQENCGVDDPEFRFIAEDPGLQPNPYKLSGMPYEVQELCSEMRGASLMEHLLEEVRRQNSEEY